MTESPRKTSSVKGQSKQTFLDTLQQISDKSREKNEFTLSEIFAILAGKGYASLLILLSIPFCIPITIPGSSTPFGILLCFLGLRIAFAKTLWWPKWLLDKKINSKHVAEFAEKTKGVIFYLQKILHPRLTIFTKNALFHRMHGILVFFLSILLSLPLPIPFSNMLAAFPILFMGLGLLEDDGLMIILSYALALLCFLAFLGLFLFGKAQLTAIFA